MPDEVTPETGNTTPVAPDWDSDENPYVSRYREAQSHLTPLQQENARLRGYESDPQAFVELGKRQGWLEVEEPAPDPTVDPRFAQAQQELAELRQWRQEVETERAAEKHAAGLELFHQDVDSWAQEAGTTLSAADHNAIFGLLMQSPNPSDEATARQITEAHIAHKNAEREAWQTEYEEQRRRPRVPTVAPGGAASTGVPNWGEMSPEEQDEYMAQRVRGA